MDYDVQHMYLGGWSFGNSMIWGNAGSGKSNIGAMYFSKLQGWQSVEPKKDFESPFKKA